MRKRIVAPDKRSITKIHLKNGLTINARIGTGYLLAIKGVFFKSHNSYSKKMKAYYDVVIDGGAHIGCFSLFIHKRSKHVYAIEPATDNL